MYFASTDSPADIEHRKLPYTGVLRVKSKSVFRAFLHICTYSKKSAAGSLFLYIRLSACSFFKPLHWSELSLEGWFPRTIFSAGLTLSTPGHKTTDSTIPVSWVRFRSLSFFFFCLPNSFFGELNLKTHDAHQSPGVRTCFNTFSGFIFSLHECRWQRFLLITSWNFLRSTLHGLPHFVGGFPSVLFSLRGVIQHSASLSFILATRPADYFDGDHARTRP